MSLSWLLRWLLEWLLGWLLSFFMYIELSLTVTHLPNGNCFVIVGMAFHVHCVECWGVHTLASSKYYMQWRFNVAHKCLIWGLCYSECWFYCFCFFLLMLVLHMCCIWTIKRFSFSYSWSWSKNLSCFKSRMVTMVAWFTVVLEANCIRPPVSLSFPPLFLVLKWGKWQGNYLSGYSLIPT